MKRIIFINIPMKSMEKDEPKCYAGRGNTGCTYEGKVRFAVNAYLAEEIEQDDEVKVVMLRTIAKNPEKNEQSEININLFKNEFEEICGSTIKGKPEYKVIETEFTETKDTLEKRYRAMLNELEQDCPVYADIDFGPRMNLMIMMIVLQFAEKFFESDVTLLYTKVEFDDVTNKIIEDSHELLDVTSFYAFGKLTNAMNADSGEEALKALDAFFKL